MQNLRKIIFSFLFVLLLALGFYIFILFDVFKINKFDFISAYQENRYKNELVQVTQQIVNTLINFNESENKKILDLFSSQKFSEKKRTQNYDLSKEMNTAKNIITTSGFGLIKIKVYDNAKKLIFSTDEKEMRKIGAYVTFISRDGIENNDGLYVFKKNKLDFIVDNSGYIIVKNNLVYNSKPVGIVLSYLNNSFINDIIREYSLIEFKNIVFLSQEILIINKPAVAKNEELFRLLNSNNKIWAFISRDKSGNETSEEYRLFYYSAAKIDLNVYLLVENKNFILNQHQIFIISLLFFIILYLFILTILLFRKSELDKTKEKIALFTASIFDEIIQAKNRTELESLQRHLVSKKKDTLQNLIISDKQLKAADKKKLEDEIDLIFQKIEEGVEKRLQINSDESSKKFEMLLEKFISTIADKGININTVNPADNQLKNIVGLKESGAINNLKKTDDLDQAEVIEDAEALEEVEELLDIADEDIEELENIDEAEAIDELTDAIEVEEISDQEDKTNQPDLSEIKSLTDIDNHEMKTKPAINTGIDEVNQVDTVGKVEHIGKIHKIGSIDEIGEITEINEVENVSAVDRIPGEKNEQKNKAVGEKTKSFYKSDLLDHLYNLSDEKIAALEEKLKRDEIDLDHDEAINTVPKIPNDFFNIKAKDDKLAEEIKELIIPKTALQILLEEIYQRIGAKKLSLLINVKEKYKFLQIHQLGANNLQIETVILDDHNMIIQHLYMKKRITYIANLDKIKNVFNNLNFESEYSDMKSTLIYPVKFFNQIRSLILMYFIEDKSEQLDEIIDILEEKKDLLRKNILKLI